MSTIAATHPGQTLKPYVFASVGLHLAILAYCGVAGWWAYTHRGENWGGPGGSISVGIVGSVPAIPLPRPDVVSPNRVVDNSKGLFKSEPQPVPKPPPDAVPIPKFEKNKPPKIISHPSKVLENPTPPPPNAVPYGGGGAPTIPVTSFAMGAGKTQAGLAFSGVGGGDFGSRFSWYVEAVQRRVSSNWLQSTVDPSVAYAPRVVVTFTILRDGTVTNVQITQRSNDYSVDNSAVRAVNASSPLDRLPPGYSGSSVNVEFYFDYHR
ncbi:MAG TPA: energy transducer TonB [Candidatus Acidoferrales bacterium]|jgi:protein TonB|nr:energy transducer TonB [Candidatus Acidoferrales bacterium]